MAKINVDRTNKANEQTSLFSIKHLFPNNRRQEHWDYFTAVLRKLHFLVSYLVTIPRGQADLSFATPVGF